MSMEDKVIEFESEIDKEDAHEYGYAIVQDGKLIKAVNRTNPNKKWDWYQVGGRWGNSLKLKDGAYTDSAKIKDIDFSLNQENACTHNIHSKQAIKYQLYHNRRSIVYARLS